MAVPEVNPRFRERIDQTMPDVVTATIARAETAFERRVETRSQRRRRCASPLRISGGVLTARGYTERAAHLRRTPAGCIGDANDPRGLSDVVIERLQCRWRARLRRRIDKHLIRLG